MNACDDITDCANCGWQDDCFYSLRRFVKGYIHVKEENPNEVKRIIRDSNVSKCSSNTERQGLWS